MNKFISIYIYVYRYAYGLLPIDHCLSLISLWKTYLRLTLARACSCLASLLYKRPELIPGSIHTFGISVLLKTMKTHKVREEVHLC